MKKVLSLVFAVLILFSGLHISIATHVCGGEIAAVKWSVTGEKATCGMENAQKPCPIHDEIASNCCQDEVSVYNIDNNYSPSSFQINKDVSHLLQVFQIPASLSFSSFNTTNRFYAYKSPRDKLQVSSVRQEAICVFLI